MENISVSNFLFPHPGKPVGEKLSTNVSFYSYMEPVSKHVLFTSRQANLFAVGIVNVMLIPIILILNVLFIRAIYLHKNLQVNPNKLLVMLSVIDIINTIISQTSFATECFLMSFDVFCRTLDRIVSMSGYSFSGISFITVIFITMERYFAISFPFKYEKFYRLWLVITLHITISATFVIATVIMLEKGSKDIFYLVLSAFILCGFIIIFFCYFKIYSISKNTMRRMSMASSKTVGTAKSHANSNRTAVIAMLILLFLFISYLPFMILSVFLTDDEEIASGNTPVDYLLVWAQTFALLNGIFSPLVYYWRINEIRKAMLGWKPQKS